MIQTAEHLAQALAEYHSVKIAIADMNSEAPHRGLCSSREEWLAKTMSWNQTVNELIEWKMYVSDILTAEGMAHMDAMSL